MSDDYYEILGVPRDADESTIKKAFRKVARELHPDVNKHDPDAEEKFKQAATAYEVLSDPERRAAYDRYGPEGLRGAGFNPGAGGFGNIEDVLNDLFGGGGASIFGDIFGFGGASAGPADGGDIGAEVQISLDDVLTGTTVEVAYEAVGMCSHCNGNGAEPGTPIKTCPTCSGQGQVRQVMQSPFGQVVRATPCRDCNGEGKIAETPCKECRGRGRVAERREREVNIPAGIESGQRIRVTGAGHAGDPGGRPGDLYVRVMVTEDERFVRDGQDLVHSLSLSATKAMTGGTADVPVLGPDDGDEEDGDTTQITIPAGVQPGSVQVLKGYGLPALGSTKRGDIRVIYDVVVPVGLDDEQLALARRLEETLGDENLRPEGRRRGLRNLFRRAG